MASQNSDAALDGRTLNSVGRVGERGTGPGRAPQPGRGRSSWGRESAFSDIAAVSEGPTVEALFWVTENGSVMQETHYPGTGWLQNTVARAGSADPYADIAAVTRGGGSEFGSWVDVFGVDDRARSSTSSRHRDPALCLPGKHRWRRRGAPQRPRQPSGGLAGRRTPGRSSGPSSTGGIEDDYHYDSARQLAMTRTAVVQIATSNCRTSRRPTDFGSYSVTSRLPSGLRF